MLLFYKWNNRLKKEVNKQTREINNANDILVKKNIQIKLERDFRDITEEKLMQENIRTKDKMQSLGNLISGIAHEIRNPLTSIRAYVELIPKKFDNPKFREMVSKDIPTEIDRLNSLINDLLEYSKPQKPYKEKTDLCEIVNKVILLLKNKLQTENIIIENNINKNIFVFIDKNQFRQVLINIVLNAVECLDKQDKRIIIWI
nr:histidine kinase dimerization/phospho-acceptor domain-containing protein [Clostridium sp. FP1]